MYIFRELISTKSKGLIGIGSREYGLVRIGFVPISFLVCSNGYMNIGTIEAHAMV